MKRTLGKSEGTDKLLDRETLPLLGGGAAVRDYDNVHPGFMGRHRNKLVAMLALVLLVYLVTATFCGWNVDSCHFK